MSCKNPFGKIAVQRGALQFFVKTAVVVAVGIFAVFVNQGNKGVLGCTGLFVFLQDIFTGYCGAHDNTDVCRGGICQISAVKLQRIVLVVVGVFDDGCVTFCSVCIKQPVTESG